MLSRRSVLVSAGLAAALSLSMPSPGRAEDALPVVATFSILGDMVARIGGAHVAVTTLVGPDGDAHVYQPTPQAARHVAEAEVLFMNGLEFEGWLERLAEAAPFSGALVVTTTGLDPLPFAEDDDHDDEAHGDHEDAHADHDDAHAEHDDGHGDHEDAQADHEDDHDAHGHGTYDPHAWHSLKNAKVYVDNITAGLAQADPDNAATFYANRAAYLAEIEALAAEVAGMMSAIPQDRRTLVTSHDAFRYFGHDHGLTFLAPQGLSTEAEASAQDVARLIEQMRRDGISAVFVENITDTRLLKQIANETGAVIGGTLYPGALSGPEGPAATYLDMIRHNATTLSQALRPRS